MINTLPVIFHTPLTLFTTLILGFTIGSLFFLSLWWVISSGLLSKRPALWFVTSFFIRISVCLFSFYLIADGDPQRLISALTGFVMARPIIKLLIGKTRLKTKIKPETKNAT